MSDDLHNGLRSTIAIGLFAAIGALMVADLLLDYVQGGGWAHIAGEFTVLVFALVGITVLWRRLDLIRSDLQQVSTEAERWRQEHQALLAGLSRAIRAQFAEWALTTAEAEVAMLLLKGLSHREIAEVRRTSERTIREQARAVYRKGGLSGRAALSAFFLEDLLQPDPT